MLDEAKFFFENNVFLVKALLRMATVNGAAVLGFFRRMGRLEKGTRFWYRIFPSEVITFLR